MDEWLNGWMIFLYLSPFSSPLPFIMIKAEKKKNAHWTRRVRLVWVSAEAHHETRIGMWVVYLGVTLGNTGRGVEK